MSELDEHEPLPSSGNQSIAMSVRILSELASSPVPLGVTEIARRLDESKARAFRHLATMKQFGLVSQEQAGDGYQLGWNIYRLGVAAANQFGLARIALRHMTRLRDRSGETTALAIPASGDALIVSSVQSERQVAIAIKSGVVIPANSSALGRVVLAFAPDEQVERVLARPLKAFSALSITDPKQLRKRLDFVRRHYYEVAINENDYGIATLAAPVFDAGNRLTAAVGIVGSGFRIARTPDPELLAAVQDCARAISDEMQSTAWTEFAGE